MDVTFDTVLTLKACETDFRIQAKDYFNKLERFHGCVFIHPNCLMVKNSDFLFHQEEGIHVVKGTKRNTAYEAIIIGNDDGNVTNRTLDCVEGFDLTSNLPVPIPRKDVTIIYFMDGHPLDKGIPESVGQVAAETVTFFRKLCPELFNEAEGPISSPFGTSGGLANSVAIIGMACRYPRANNLDEFWDLLIQGKEGIRKVPDDRWTPDKAFIRMDNTRNTEAGFLSCPVENFDAKFFNINGADASFVDPQQRLALRIVWEALEHAGVDPLSLKGSLTGVFGGWWKEDYKETLQDAEKNFEASEFLRSYLGNGLGPLTARISHFFEFIGPAFSTESGCSTSIAGVDMGCNALRNEECHLAVCVGINLLLHPFALGSDKLEGLLAADGRSKVFDQSADGFGRAEGVGAVILKRYPDAVKDGDRIWGLIRGEAIVQEGTSKSMGTPTVNVEAKAMELALRRAGVKASEIDFMEMHATGTPVGDPIESAAVARVYSKEPRENTLLIGSVKGNVGHTESVCGITSIHKMVLAMKNEVIPPTRNLKNIQPQIAQEFAKVPALISMEPVAWKRNPKKPRICAINSFGITGAQANIIVQEPPEHSLLPIWNFQDNRDLKMLTFSGKFKDALQRNMETYIDFLSRDDSPELRDVEYNMHLGRAHLYFRHVVLGETKNEIVEKLKSDVANGGVGHPISALQPKIGFLFTGQGCQYPGMGKTLYEQSAVFRSHFDWCESILQRGHGLSIKDALWGEDASSRLNTPLYSLIGIFVVEYCLLRLWESWGVKPDLVLGHSTGEFTAAVAAGIMTIEEALLLLVVTRSKLVEKLPPGKMLIVNASLEKTETFLKGAYQGVDIPLDVAAVNTPDQTVVAGSIEDIGHFKMYCTNNGLTTFVLNTPQAFHSRMVDPIMEKYKTAANRIAFKPPTLCRYISSAEGREIERAVDADYWVRHTRYRVNFVEASKVAIRALGDVSTFIEIGPQPVLCALLGANVDSLDDSVEVTCLPSLRRGNNDWEQMLGSLGKLYYQGTPINWGSFHQNTKANKGDVPGYSFDESQEYWMTIPNDGNILIHPLLGKSIPNASGIWIFQNSLKLNSFGFIKDHILQGKPIFLCAGYLEMLMAAFNYAKTERSEMPAYPVGVRDFGIKVPIIIDEVHGAEFQVVVTYDLEGNLVGKIYTRLNLDDKNFKWVENASGIAASVEPGVIKFPDLHELKEACCVTVKDRISYAEVGSHSFQLGPSLRNVQDAWVDPDGQRGVLFTYEVADSQPEIDRFFVHPGISDPILQMQGLEYLKSLSGNSLNKKPMVVPVQVGAFTKWNTKIPKKGYFHIQRVKGVYMGTTYHENGNVVASLTEVEFLETTMNNVLALVEGERNPYPQLGEITWNEQLGPCEKRIEREQLEKICFKDYEVEALAYEIFSEEETQEYNTMNEVQVPLILKLFSELGLQTFPEFSWPAICDKIGVTQVYQKYFRYLLLQVKEAGWIQQDCEDGNSFKILKPLPTDEEIRKWIELAQEKAKSSERCLTAVRHYKKLSDSLKSIITGNISALPLFYPENKSGQGIAEFFYTESLHAQKLQALLGVGGSMITEISKIGKHVIRVLEVGAGLGSATRTLIRQMVDAGSHNFEYTYTDVSSSFLKNGEGLFANTGLPAKFQIFNLEEDPLQQGFTPEYFDVVVASLVCHATRDLEESVSNITKVLRPGGLLLISELVRPDISINYVFGAIEESWKFQDNLVRPWNFEAEPQVYHDILRKQGFSDFASYETYQGSSSMMVARNGDKVPGLTPMDKVWVVLGNVNCLLTDKLMGKMEYLGYSAILLTKESLQTKGDAESQFTQLFGTRNVVGLVLLWGIDQAVTLEIGEPFLYVCQFLHNLHLSYTLNFMIVTKGTVSTGLNDYVSARPDCSVLTGMGKVLANEAQELRCKFVDYNDTMEPEKVVDSIISELFSQDDDTTIAFREDHRFVPRFRTIKIQQTALTLPNSPRYQLVIPPSNMVSDLRFAPCEAQILADDEVEIQVKAYSLNFRDTFTVTKPDPVFKNDDNLGTDVCGVITAVGLKVDNRWKVGDRVVTFRQFGCALPSHVVAKSDILSPLPDWMTGTDGSTIPLAGGTVLRSLIHEAKVTKDDTVLVHAASGGVGLLAVNRLLHVIKCEFVVTAGTERKRNYLLGLGVKHVFNSRNTNYGEDIRKALGGRGVTVVLNSLTGPGFKEATLSLCESGARFIEISKLNIWSPGTVSELRPDVDYRIVDVQSLEPEEFRVFSKDISRMTYEGGKSIKSVTFDCTEIRAALNYLEKVQHIGKICVRMREPQTSPGDPQFPLFNRESSYLITGGLGGIGLEVAKWMVIQGAGTIILLGRNPPNSITVLEIEKMKKKATIIVKLCDVGEYEELEPIMFCKDYNPIRGIMHCAGVIDDDPFDKQTWGKYKNVFHGKAKGAWNLHLLSKKIKFELEHFVLFSSLASTIGAHSQSNYAAANSYLDALGQYRVAHGLPSLTINWGQWAQIGMAANLVSPFFEPFSVSKGIAALEYAMRTVTTELCAYEADLGNVRKAAPTVRGLFANVEDKGKMSDLVIDQDQLWTEYDGAETREEKQVVIRRFLHQILRTVLKLNPSDEIDDNREFQEMGLDSLMMVEIKNTLQTTMRKRAKITIASVKDYNTVSLLCKQLVDLISGKQETPALSREEIYSLVSKDWKLLVEGNSELAPRSTLTEIGNVSIVLVTGATGCLGSYIVTQLAELPQIKKIFCLVRPGSTGNVVDKFRRCFMKKGLYTENVKEKAELVEGDLRQPYFSLKNEEFLTLADQVEAVFHAAAKVTFTERYKDTDEPDNCRKVNVEGTRTLFKFSMLRKLKHVYHASTLLVAMQMDKNTGLLSEAWPAIDEINTLPDMSYLITKFVSEGLAEKISKLGVPVKVFRLPYAGPDSGTGENMEFSHFAMIRAFCYMHLGVMPSESIPFNMLPIDIAAKLSLQIFFHPQSGSGIYNICNPITNEEADFPEVAAEFGRHVQVLEPEAFKEFIRNIGEDDIYKELQNLLDDGEKSNGSYVTSEDDILRYKNLEAPFYMAWINGNKNLYRSEKVEKYASTEGIPSSFEVYKAALKSAKKEGIFDKFKIPYTT